MALESKLRVLFVDDEPAILRGLRSVLHRDRAVWDMAFANSASEALTLMDQGPFDVVITDMRMPEMDGAELLSVVQAKWPATCRIVLSGQADRDSLLRVMPTMHSFLSKPCRSDDLRAAIKRCTSVLSITSDPALRSLIGRVDRLPSPPETFMRLTKVAQDPRARIDDIAAVVAQDSAFALKVMQIASSAAFGEGAQTTSLHRCVAYLGIELLKVIALSDNLYSAYRGPTLPISLEALQAHALRTATLARAFIKDDLAFAAGLLHDIGRVVLQLGLPAEYGKMLEELKHTGESLVAGEKRVFGADHAAVGGCLMRTWGLPEQLIEAVEHHHEPELASATVADVIAVVGVAEALADNSDATQIDLEFLQRTNLIDKLPAWRAIAATLAA